MTDRHLSDKEAAFCRHYIVTHNATEAAIAAGYGKRGARTEGHRLLKRPHVAAEIQRLEGEAMRRADTVSKMLTNADAGIRRQIEAETDASIIAATTRAYVLAALRENMEVCLGRRKCKALKQVTELVEIDGKKVKRKVTIEVEIYDRNPTAANQAANLLLQAAEIGGSKLAEDAEDENADLHRAMAEFEGRK